MNNQSDQLRNWQINQINETLKSVEVINQTLKSTSLVSGDISKLHEIRSKLIKHIHFVDIHNFTDDDE